MVNFQRMFLFDFETSLSREFYLNNSIIEFRWYGNNLLDLVSKFYHSQIVSKEVLTIVYWPSVYQTTTTVNIF